MDAAVAERILLSAVPMQPAVSVAGQPAQENIY